MSVTKKILDNMHEISEMNPGVGIVKLLKEVVDLKWGGEFTSAWNNDVLLSEATEHYLKIKKKDRFKNIVHEWEKAVQEEMKNEK